MNRSAFELFLDSHDERSWDKIIKEILPSIHEVDKTATQIWFAFYPLKLSRALKSSDNPEKLAQDLQLQGSYRLEEQIDSSHQFLYGHRYWTAVKREIVKLSKTGYQGSLADIIKEISGNVAAEKKVDPTLLTGITAVLLMTLQQVGLEKFSSASESIRLNDEARKRSAQEILSLRAKDDSQGLFGFLKTHNKRWTVTFNENNENCKFDLMHMQEIASGAQTDTRDYSSLDHRRIEGPIPVECRSAACGACWVGVLGGAEKLTELSARERRMLKQFGYLDTEEQRPFIRLSCQAQGLGALSIVIPPWNGVLKPLEKMDEQQ
jgi:ferredoxin